MFLLINRDSDLIMQMSNISSITTALREHQEFGSSDIPVQPDYSAIQRSSSSSKFNLFSSSVTASASMEFPVADFIVENKFGIVYPDNKTENYFDSALCLGVLPENHFYAMTRKVSPYYDSASI